MRGPSMFKWLHSTGCSLRELCSSFCNVAEGRVLPSRATGLLIESWPMSSQLGHVLVCKICLPKSVLVYHALQKTARPAGPCRLLVLHNRLTKWLYPLTNFREKYVFLTEQIRDLQKDSLGLVLYCHYASGPCSTMRTILRRWRGTSKSKRCLVRYPIFRRNELLSKWTDMTVSSSCRALDPGSPECRRNLSPVLLQEVNYSPFRHCCCPLYCMEGDWNCIRILL